ncbi:hypothetical protein [Emticicia oligotrophica]|uniref:hypothetical protein n=1 Tax=Emticicia oligotrophica TaxID=312279 RepID=UPI00273C02EA|nr:hypothetical protein [Emticicia oligotrophica]
MTISRYTLTIGLILTIAGGQSCGSKINDPTTIKNIKLTDTPQNKAAFMNDVKPVILYGAVGTLDFDAVWKDDHYELQPKSMIDFTEVSKILETYSTTTNLIKEDLLFSFSYTSDSVRIFWILPYNYLKSIGGKQNLNSNIFDKYIGKSDVSPNGGNPTASLKKHAYGSIVLDIGRIGSTNVLQRIQLISPYYFGK